MVLALISIWRRWGWRSTAGASSTREAVLKTDLFDLRDFAIDQYYADKGNIPARSTRSSPTAIRKIPVDPFTNAADTWQTVPSDPDPNNPTAAPGIFNVGSGSERTAIDGSKYSDIAIW